MVELLLSARRVQAPSLAAHMLCTIMSWSSWHWCSGLSAWGKKKHKLDYMIVWEWGCVFFHAFKCCLLMQRALHMLMLYFVCHLPVQTIFVWVLSPFVPSAHILNEIFAYKKTKCYVLHVALVIWTDIRGIYIIKRK